MTNKYKLLLSVAATLVASPAVSQRTLGSGETGANWSVPTTNYPLGSAPADSVEPAEIADSVTESQFIVTGEQLTTDRAVSGAFYVNPSDNTADRKLRFQCEPSDTVLAQDFVLQNVSHLHAPFGLKNWTQNSNYTSARANPSGSCSGGPLLSQIYIEPAMMDTLANGASVVRRPQTQTVYYVGLVQNAPHRETWVRRDSQFIMGANPMNYNDQTRRDAYTAGGFTYPGGLETPAGFGGWTCETGPNQVTAATVTRVASRMKAPNGTTDPLTARHLRAEDGSDPWGGGCVQFSDAKPAILLMTLIAPQCWNRNHLQTADGREHFWYAATKSDGSIVDACPTLPSGAPYARVPEPQFKSMWAVKDFNDYKNMYFSSDRMNPSNTPADPTSLDPCRKIGPWFCNASTGHADWGYGAKSSIFEEGQRECLGITVRGVTPQYAGGAECNFGQLSRMRALLSGGASPNQSLTAGCFAILQCFDSIPTKRKELYLTPPKQKSGVVHIMPGM